MLAMPRWAPRPTPPICATTAHDAIGIGVQQLSNANALEVDREAKAELDELAKTFPARAEVRDSLRHHDGRRRFDPGSGR